MAFADQHIADIAPFDGYAAKRASIAILTAAMQLRRLPKDDAQTVTRGISRRRVTSLAPWATGKLWRVYGAALGDEADLHRIAAE